MPRLQASEKPGLDGAYRCSGRRRQLGIVPSFDEIRDDHAPAILRRGIQNLAGELLSYRGFLTFAFVGGALDGQLVVSTCRRLDAPSQRLHGSLSRDPLHVSLEFVGGVVPPGPEAF